MTAPSNSYIFIGLSKSSSRKRSRRPHICIRHLKLCEFFTPNSPYAGVHHPPNSSHFWICFGHLRTFLYVSARARMKNNLTEPRTSSEKIRSGYLIFGLLWKILRFVVSSATWVYRDACHQSWSTPCPRTCSICWECCRKRRLLLRFFLVPNHTRT